MGTKLPPAPLPIWKRLKIQHYIFGILVFVLAYMFAFVLPKNLHESPHNLTPTPPFFQQVVITATATPSATPFFCQRTNQQGCLRK